MITIVTTQEELDAAVEGGAERIVIDSPPTVWLHLRGSAHVVARESSCVVALESSYVVAWGSSYVVAFGSSHVVALESSYVVALESSRVVAWGLSHVVARGSSRVDARESSSVVARGSSHVVASPWVTVHLHSTRATVTGGIVIDAMDVDLSDPTVWAAYYGVVVQDGAATVYKAVSQEFVAGQGHTLTTYAIGSTVEATDWDPAPERGHGLHFSPSPAQAWVYYLGDGEPRYLACEVDIASLVPLGNKCKAPRCRVLHEVDQFGDPIVSALDDEQETPP